MLNRMSPEKSLNTLEKLKSGDIKYPDKLAQDLSKDAKQVREGIKDLRPQIQSGHVNAWQYDALIDKTSQDLKLSQDQHDAVRAKVEHDRKVEGWKDLGMGAIALGASLTPWGAGRTIAWGATRATGWALGSFMSAKEIGRHFEDRSFANVNMGYNRTNDVFKSQGAPSELGVALAAASFVPGVGSGVSSALRGLKQSEKLGAMTQATGQALNRAAQEGKQVVAEAAEKLKQYEVRAGLKVLDKNATHKIAPKDINPTNGRKVETGATRKEIAYWDFEAAEKSYDIIRNTDDISAIAKNTGMADFQIKKIKDHIFNNTHRLDDGRVAQFDAHPAIANAWNRLQKGTYSEADIALLNHELFESKFEGIFKVDYRTAHGAANRSGRPSGIE